ncbi:MAG TPA: response regulator [Gemmatimonadaceae bacterium]|nr:response regulator [Gemmatimonadaceae bacterium]
MRMRTVLHVDDDARLRAGVARALRREPYEILGVAGAAEALAVLRACLVDVLVCDEAMPGMLGTELLAQVRREFPGVVSILLTGYGSLEVAQRAVNQGQVYRLLTKPCDADGLAVAIREALRHKLLLEHGGAPAGELAVAGPTTTADDDPYPTTPVIELDDAPVDLQQLLAELEARREPVAGPAAASGD